MEKDPAQTSEPLMDLKLLLLRESWSKKSVHEHNTLLGHNHPPLKPSIEHSPRTIDQSTNST